MKSSAPPLGDISAFSTIVTDVQSSAAKSDLAGALIFDLETVWSDSMAAPNTGEVQKVAGILNTDDTGYYLPCEGMIKQVRASTLSPEINDLITKATERCNSDDDLHANTFSAQALAKQGAK